MRYHRAALCLMLLWAVRALADGASPPAPQGTDLLAITIPDGQTGFIDPAILHDKNRIRSCHAVTAALTAAAKANGATSLAVPVANREPEFSTFLAGTSASNRGSFAPSAIVSLCCRPGDGISARVCAGADTAFMVNPPNIYDAAGASDPADGPPALCTAKCAPGNCVLQWTEQGYYQCAASAEPSDIQDPLGRGQWVWSGVTASPVTATTTYAQATAGSARVTENLSCVPFLSDPDNGYWSCSDPSVRCAALNGGFAPGCWQSSFDSAPSGCPAGQTPKIQLSSLLTGYLDQQKQPCNPANPGQGQMSCAPTAGMAVWQCQ